MENQQKIKEQAAEIERLKALLQADESNKKIEELEAREAEYQEQLKRKNDRIVKNDQLISFQQDILSGFGIDAHEIDFWAAQRRLEAELKAKKEAEKENKKE